MKHTFKVGQTYKDTEGVTVEIITFLENTAFPIVGKVGKSDIAFFNEKGIPSSLHAPLVIVKFKKGEIVESDSGNVLIITKDCPVNSAVVEGTCIFSSILSSVRVGSNSKNWDANVFKKVHSVSITIERH